MGSDNQNERQHRLARATHLERFDTLLEVMALGRYEPEVLGARIGVEPPNLDGYFELAEWLGWIGEGRCDLTERGRRYVGNPVERWTRLRETLMMRPLIAQVMGSEAWPLDPSRAVRSTVERQPERGRWQRVAEHVDILVALLRRASLLDEATENGEVPWQEALPEPDGLPVAAVNLPESIAARAHALQLETLGAFVEADPGEIAGARGPETVSAEEVVEWQQEVTERLGRDLEIAHPVAQRLLRDGWSLDTPWETVLVDLPTRAFSAFERLGLETIGEVLVAVAVLELRRVRGIGDNTVEAVRRQLHVIAERGYAVYLYGPGGKPQTVSGLADRMLNLLDAEARDIMRRRFLEGKTFSDIGEHYGLTRQRIRQKTGDYLDQLREHFGGIAGELAAPVVEALDRGAGLIHREAVELLTGCANLYQVLLTVLLVDDDAYIWNRHFLANRPATKLERGALAEVRRAIADSHSTRVSLREGVSLARRAGISVGSEGVRDLVATGWQLECDRRSTFPNRWTNKGDRIAEVMLEERHPMTLEEIAEGYKQRYATEDEAEPTSRRVQPFVKKHPNIYTVGNGEYVHRVALPVDARLLDDIVDWCVDRIRGEERAISVKVLLEQLRQGDWGLVEEIEELNWYLLRDVLLRRAGVMRFQNAFDVAWGGSVEDEGTTLLERVERILREADEPIDSDEVVERLPENFEVNPHSVENYLVSEDFSIRLDFDAYVHRQNLGLSEDLTEQILDAAVGALPEDGSVVGTPSLMEAVGEVGGAEVLVERPRGDSQLWGLLRHDDRVETAANRLVARAGDHGEGLLGRAIRDVLEQIGPSYPRQVDRALSDQFGFEVSDSRVYRRIRDLCDQGRIGRLSSGMYYPAGLEDEELVALFARRVDTLAETVEEADTSDWSSDELWVLARLFRREGREDLALQLLECLVDRDDPRRQQWVSFRDRVT